jgi:hypothetical protein
MNDEPKHPQYRRSLRDIKPTKQDKKSELPPENDQERMKKWQTLIDQKIREVIGDGNVSHLSGAGQPLKFALEDEFTPDEMRLAYKVMQDHDVVPAWMSLRYVLEDKQKKIRKRLRVYARNYQERLEDARRKASFLMERDAETRWQEALDKIREDIEAYNRELLNYNLTVPAQVGQRRPMNFTDEVRSALEDATR